MSQLLFSDPTSLSHIAIIGGGIGGIATAYFCSPTFRIDLFEERHKIGGHCDSIAIPFLNREFVIDLGAQFFHPKSHPLYMSLLSELGLFCKKSLQQLHVIQTDVSLNIFSLEQRKHHFVSTYPMDIPFWAVDFAVFAQKARQVVLTNSSWEVTVEDWLASLPIRQFFREKILLPWIAALIGTTVENTRNSSIRSILQTFALTFPRMFYKKATTWNSLRGLGGIIDAIAAATKHLTIHTDAQVTRLEEKDGQWFIDTKTDQYGPFSAVIVNAMPHASRHFIKQLSWAGDLIHLLDQYEYFDARVVIHDDPVYMPENRRYWTMYNAGIESDSCEGSVWLGGIHKKINGQSIDIFKSWAYRRQKSSRNVLAERSFRHPLITPNVIRAVRNLKQWQGIKGLWFVGQHVTGMDLQEAGVFAAMKVADALAPQSPTLKAFKAHLARHRLHHISYDV